MFSVKTLVALVVAVFGVRVAVQVMPPSAVLRLLSAPLGALKLAVVKPVTVSEKAMVIVAVSPTRRALSLIAIALGVGATRSMV